jgi:ATP-dependent exoDNAse (exonuclease V) alpha subunit
MLYVALSRARTPEGLHIVAPGGAKQFEARITVNEKIRRWL